MKPIIYWPRKYRWTLGPLVWLFAMVPLAILGVARDTAAAAWDFFWNGFCASAAEAIELLIAGGAAVVLGAAHKRDKANAKISNAEPTT
ncbi:MAG: hypothetical protein ABFD89_01865 [Bryobacteraceae bacterium]